MPVARMALASSPRLVGGSANGSGAGGVEEAAWQRRGRSRGAPVQEDVPTSLAAPLLVAAASSSAVATGSSPLGPGAKGSNGTPVGGEGGQCCALV